MDNIQTPDLRPISTIIASVLLFVSVLLSLQRVDKFLRIKAVDDCARVGRFEQEFPDNRSKISSPETEVYNACLKAKGY